MSRKKRIILISLATLLLWTVGFCIHAVYFRPSLPVNKNIRMVERHTVDSAYFTFDRSWLLQNNDGLWEMYIEGDPLYRGNVCGALSKDLIASQEEAFVDQINRMVPSNFLLRFLRLFISIYNRNIGTFVPEEYKEEIYACAQYASDKFHYIGNNYQRLLNYHAAHDIGHAVQLMGFAGCSSLGVWNSKTDDTGILLGRNFDFYVGDDFAKNKMVVFVRPNQGHKHAFVSWGGMFGVVSGMNDQGLVVELNAAPGTIPFSAAAPVSIVARKILQYAKNIEEATAIADSMRTFVSEQFIIASAADRKVVAIEKTSSAQVTYGTDKDYMICTNHFQSEALKPLNDSSTFNSMYRHRRMQEWIDSIPVFTPQRMVDLLRDTKGVNGATLELGDERCINQLIAHHSIVFQPGTLTMWVSTAPWQEGRFVAYRLDEIFNMKDFPSRRGVADDNLSIAADSAFIHNVLKNYPNYHGNH